MSANGNAIMRKWKRIKQCEEDLVSNETCHAPTPVSAYDSQNEIIDYSPTIFLRCHSKNNDTADKRTSVWQCAFEPARRVSPNKYKDNRLFATCGGNSICCIDAEDGAVVTKHYSMDHGEDFTTMAWTSFPTCDGQMNILAVAGKKNVLHLMHPDEAVCFAEHRLMKNKNRKHVNIESMCFHPTQRSILFCAYTVADVGEVHVWDIGTPLPEFTSDLGWMHTLPTQSPGTALTFSTHCNVLLCATGKGVVSWSMPQTPLRKTDKFKERSFTFPTLSENLAPEDQNFVDSIEAIGDGKMIATKCALHGNIYIWNLEDTLKSKAQVIEPIHILKWSSTDNYYMNLGINAGANILACGDDQGDLWIYNLEEILGERRQEHECKNVIVWPNVRDAELTKQKKLAFNRNIDIVVNRVALNNDACYLVAVTSTNTVCIWKRTPQA